MPLRAKVTVAETVAEAAWNLFVAIALMGSIPAQKQRGQGYQSATTCNSIKKTGAKRDERQHANYIPRHHIPSFAIIGQSSTCLAIQRSERVTKISPAAATGPLK
jgi:hypothetical protein